MTTAERILEAVVAALPEHVARQRWSPAVSASVTGAELAWHEVIRDSEPYLIWGVATVSLSDDSRHDLQLLIGARSVGDLPDFLHGKEREGMAFVPGDDGAALVAYDALVDPDLAKEWLHRVAPDVRAEVTRPIVLEHANSSVVFDEELILKLFRRIGAGPNPDAEVPRTLAEAGFAHVLAPIAELRHEGVDMAVLRPFLVGAMSAWQLASTSLRDMLADRQQPEEAGADMAPDAARLGTVIGEMHVALAHAFGAEPGDGAAWAEAMVLRLEDGGASSRAVVVEPSDRDRVIDRFRVVEELGDCGAGIRIHGNLHLDQIIRADAGWFVLDFEGTPDRRVASPSGMASPLRDVAGLLRSLHQATGTLLSQWHDADSGLRRLAAAWEERSRAAFLDAYLAVEGVAALIPASETDCSLLLHAFELDRAIHPVGHRVVSPSVDREAVADVLGVVTGS